jgi:hypothetical protein
MGAQHVLPSRESRMHSLVSYKGMVDVAMEAGTFDSNWILRLGTYHRRYGLRHRHQPCSHKKTLYSSHFEVAKRMYRMTRQGNCHLVGTFSSNHETDLCKYFWSRKASPIYRRLSALIAMGFGGEIRGSSSTSDPQASSQTVQDPNGCKNLTSRYKRKPPVFRAPPLSRAEVLQISAVWLLLMISLIPCC